jgi:prepilin peptidase CpaA
MPQLLQYALLAIFPVLVVIGGLRDLTTFIIPNWISAVLALAFLPAALACGLSPAELGLHLGIGSAGFVVGVAMFALGWIGGGDAKLFAASSLWFGWPAAGVFVLATSMAGGALAVFLLAMRTDWVRAHTPLSVPPWTHRLMESGGPAPYGVAIACGALFAFPSSSIVSAFGAQ